MRNTKRRIEPLFNGVFFGDSLKRTVTSFAVSFGLMGLITLYDPVYGAENWYLLCYDDVIVEINFDWEPTAEQMKIAGEKLSF